MSLKELCNSFIAVCRYADHANRFNMICACVFIHLTNFGELEVVGCTRREAGAAAFAYLVAFDVVIDLVQFLRRRKVFSLCVHL